MSQPFEPFSVLIDETPDPELSPNRAVRHSHWSQRSAPRERARFLARHAAMNQLGMNPTIPGKTPIVLQIIVRSTRGQRGLDADNAVASVKSYIDGIFDHLGQDDRNIETITLTVERNAPRAEMLFIFMDKEMVTLD